LVLILMAERPDAVIHFGCETRVDRSTDAPTAFIETNVMGAFVLLQEASSYVAKIEQRMNVERLSILPDVLLIRPAIFQDERGLFMETWRASTYEALGIPPFVQNNVSVSRRHVLRGLHLQHPDGQGKLVSVLAGSVFDVAVDVRVGSPTFGRWAGAELSRDNALQLYIPEGFAHGFITLSDESVFSYKCTRYYEPGHERTVRWDDPELGIAWPCRTPILTERDRSAPTLRAMPPALLPVFHP
jgi:dTDP-4-dehydrorhamnose 3,5-epimerase